MSNPPPAPSAYEEARSALMSYLQTNYRQPRTPEQIAANQPGTPWLPIEYENRAFTPPKGTLWGRASLQWGDAMPASIGTGHRRSMAILFLQVFAPENSGTADTNRVIEALATLMDHLQLNTEHCEIRLDVVSRQTVGRTESLYQTNAFVRVTADSYFPV